MKWLTILLLMFLAVPASSEPDDDAENQTPASVDRESKQSGSSEPQEQSEKAEPQGEKLRSKDIGEAFKNFRPSEAIEAGNPVPFPVDI